MLGGSAAGQRVLVGMGVGQYRFRHEACDLPGVKFTSVGNVLSGDFTGTGEVIAREGMCPATPVTSVTVVDTVHVGR